MTTAGTVLRSKADQAIYTIAADASVFDAVKLMSERNVGALLVTTDRGGVAGMITERDYARKIVLMARSSKDTPVRDAMTSPVIYVGPERTSEECMALMTEHRVRHLAVIVAGKLTGIISIGDLVKDIISEQKFTIEQLTHYIAG